MGKLRWHPLLTLALAFPLPSCSLLGLDDFGVAPCTSDADCANSESQLRPSPQACGSAVCEPDGLCKWREGTEVCNGKDDDCDGLIDEDLVFAVPKNGPAARAPAAFAYASRPQPEQTFVAVAHGASSQGSALGPRGTPFSALKAGALEKSARNFAEVALAADANHLFVANINTLGCAAGQIQVGLSNIDEAPFDVWFGKAEGAQSEEPSHLVPGIDVDDDKGCSGASLSANGIGSGATRPAVASLGAEADGEGALLLWLGASASSTDPHSDSMPVEALGLVIAPGWPQWLDGTKQGTPTELGKTTSLSAPAVLALESRSGAGKYLVAFPAEQEGSLGVRLLTVRADGAGLHVEPCPPLEGGPAEQVSLALGATEGTAAQVGITWRTGTASEAQLHFLIISQSGQALSEDQVLSVPNLDPRFAPQIMHRDSGFATQAPTGGWFRSWVETDTEQAQTFHLARLRDSTLVPLNLTPLSERVVAQPLLYRSANDDASVGYAFIDSTAETGPETFINWCH